MSAVKRKLRNKSLKKECEIIRHIEKGMAKKKGPEKFGVPKNAISTWMKNKEKQHYRVFQKSWLNVLIKRCLVEKQIL